MALNDAALNVGANAIAAILAYASLHSAAPNTSGSNETSAGRQAIAWDAAANGDTSLTGTENFTGGAANGDCKFVGFWSAAAAGTFYGYLPLTGDQTFNAAGEYILSDVNLNGSAG